MNGIPNQRLDLPSGDLTPIFRPRSVAVIGAGRDPTSMSGRLFRNLLATFRGPVYPINPKTPEIASVRTWNSILDVPGPVDLAFVAVPAAGVLATVEECVAKPVRGLVVISAGFSEIGGTGKLLERSLLEIVRASGIRMIGPNCFGVFNTDSAVQLQGTFAAANTPPGNIAIGTQSGALGVVIPDYLRQWNLGASTFASIGNKADVSENDLLEYWRDDPATDVVLLYLESFCDPVGFRRLASEVTRHKPIVALKAARTTVGERAASSHTAALAGPDRAAEALLRQSGVLRVGTLQELFEATALLSSQPLPRGDRVAVLTNAGGPAILCADALAAKGLLLPEASSELQGKLRKQLRPEAGVKNPIDLIGSIDAGEFRHCLELIFDSREFDAVVTIYVPREPETSAGIACAVREVTQARAQGTTSLAVFMETAGMPGELHDEAVRIPGYLYPEGAAGALACAREQSRMVTRPLGSIPQFAEIDSDACRRLIEAALRRFGPVGGWLEPAEVQELLSAAGWRVPRWKIVDSADGAVVAATMWNAPVVLKVIAPGVLHKSDAGGVIVNVAGEGPIRAAWQRVTAAVPAARSAMVQEFISGGQEAFIGVSREPQFGHLLAVGCGGTQVELVNDISCRLHPLNDVDADEMLGSLKTAALLTGYRGRPAADVAALKETLHRVSSLVTIVPEIAELDFNPVAVLAAGAGIVVLDGRIRLVSCRVR
ncbi:MAG: acetate--CoA ligase family protein [Planctomycetales bacterium]